MEKENTSEEKEVKQGSEIKKRISKLIDVKSLMTLSMTIAFVIMTMSSGSISDQFYDIFKTIVIFYFGTQVGKA